jgi:hypothetical protein
MYLSNVLDLCPTPQHSNWSANAASLAQKILELVLEGLLFH